MNSNHLHEEELRQLTGCPYSVLILLKSQLTVRLSRPRAGRPFRHVVWVMLVATLIKLRSDTAYRTLELYLHIQFVTLQRIFNRICPLLASMPLGRYTAHRFLIVDGTCTRVRSTDGATGENQILFRPVKRNEKEYKNKKEATKAFNRELSRWRVMVEHVFAQLKTFKILSGLFSLPAEKYGMCFRAIAVLYNLTLDAKIAKK